MCYPKKSLKLAINVTYFRTSSKFYAECNHTICIFGAFRVYILLSYSSFTCMTISKMLANQFVFAVNRTCKVRRMRSGEYANLVRISSFGDIGQPASTLNGASLVGR